MGQRILTAATVIMCGLVFTACSTANAGVPADLLGVQIDMPRGEAEQKLRSIAKLERSESGSQQLWRLTADPRFSTLAIGYDKSGRVRYVTAFVDKSTATERIRFSSIGDITKSKAEILPPHYRYVWEVRPDGGGTSFLVNVYGDEPNYLTIYTIARPSHQAGEIGEQDDDGD